jgi:hypothetical protein
MSTGELRYDGELAIIVPVDRPVYYEWFVCNQLFVDQVLLTDLIVMHDYVC